MSRQLMTSFVWAASLLSAFVVAGTSIAELGVKKAFGMGLLVWFCLMAIGYIGRALFWREKEDDKGEF